MTKKSVTGVKAGVGPTADPLAGPPHALAGAATADLEAIKLAPLMRVLNEHVRSLAQAVDADWHDSWEETGQEVQEWFETCCRSEASRISHAFRSSMPPKPRCVTYVVPALIGSLIVLATRRGPHA